MAAKRITERVAFQGGRVDRTGPRPVVREVLLCGPVSANRRRYLKGAFEGERVKRYEGKPVFMNHTGHREARRYEDRIAKVVNARHRADGMPIGDLEVRPKHPYAETFLDDAEFDPRSCGLSHVAQCETVTSRDGWEEITEVVSVESVDLVLDPATTPGLCREGKQVPRISLKQFSERFGARYGPKKWAALARLCEEFPDMADAPAIEEPPADAPADEGDLKTALVAALAPFLDEAFETGNSDAACAAVRDFVKMHAKHTGNGDKGDDDKGDDSPADDSPADDGPPKESKNLPQPWDVLRECRAADYSPTETALKFLAKEPDAAERKAFIAEQKALLADSRAQRPQSAPRKAAVAESADKRVTWAD